MRNEHPENDHDRDLAGSATAQELLWSYIERLNGGERVDEAVLRSEHPEFADELLPQLEAFTEIGADVADESAPLGTVGDYTLRREIGRGGMGVVYDAWENTMERQVALKVLPAGIAADRKSYTRFMREAKTAGQLRHPNIVSVHTMGMDDNTPYYAMEYVGGETLARLLARSKDAEPDATTPFGYTRLQQKYYFHLAEVFAEVADGLEHAHSKGVVHRDIKPSNLILDGEGHLRILDFGLAHLEGDDSLTASGDVVGTPLYMSPEQARRRGIPIDHRTDIYSLGATLYELLTGQPQFKGKDHEDTLSQIIRRDPAGPRKLNPRIPRDLETIVLKCLRKEPAHRYATASALAEDLTCFARGDPIEARPQSKWEKLARRLWRARFRLGLRTAAAAVIVVLLAVLGAMLLEPRGTSIRQVWEMPPGVDPMSIWADRNYIAYVDWNDGSLGVHDLLREESRVVSASDYEDGWNEDAAISPDGKRIAYTRYNKKDRLYDLRVVNRNGSQERVLYHDARLSWVETFEWSPDSEDVLVTFVYKDGDDLLARVGANDGSVHALKTWKKRVARPWMASFSPDGRYVAFDLGQEENSERRDIYLVEASGEGAEVTPLLTYPADDRLLGWVPEGADGSDSNRILFASDRISGRRLWLADVKDGKPQGTPTLVQRVGEFYGRPIGFTRDGSYYYVVSTSEHDVYLAELDAKEKTLRGEPRKVSSLGPTSSFEWSADGKRLAYRVHRAFAIYDLETRRERVLEPSPAIWREKPLQGPRFSPDGKSLLVNGTVEGTGPGLYRVEIENGKSELIRERTGFPQSAVWSPDGKSVYYVHQLSDVLAEGPPILFRRDLESGEEEKIYEGDIRGSLEISPDGESIAFRQAPESLVVLPSAGGTPREVVRLKEQEAGPHGWTPGGGYLLISKRGEELWRVAVETGKQERIVKLKGGLGRAALQPGGNHIAFTRGKPSRSELWVMEDFLPEEAEVAVRN